MTKQAAFIHAAPSVYDNDIVLACEELNFCWRPYQIKQVVQMWENGLSIDGIAKEMNRDVDEVAILIIDQGRKGTIQSRTCGVWGVV